MKDFGEKKLRKKAYEFDSSNESNIDGEINQEVKFKITPLTSKKNQEKSLYAEKSKIIRKPRSRLSKLSKKQSKQSNLPQPVNSYA